MIPENYLLLFSTALCLLTTFLLKTHISKIEKKAQAEQQQIKAQNHVFKILGTLHLALQIIQKGIPKVSGDGENFTKYKRATQKFHKEWEDLQDYLENMEKKWSPLWNLNLNLGINTLAAFHEDVLEKFYLIEESFKYHKEHVEILRLAMLESHRTSPITIDTTAANRLKTTKEFLSKQISA